MNNTFRNFRHKFLNIEKAEEFIYTLTEKNS